MLKELFCAEGDPHRCIPLGAAFAAPANVLCFLPIQHTGCLGGAEVKLLGGYLPYQLGIFQPGKGIPGIFGAGAAYVGVYPSAAFKCVNFNLCHWLFSLADPHDGPVAVFKIKSFPIVCDAIAVVDVAVSVVRGGDAVAVVVGGAGAEEP